MTDEEFMIIYTTEEHNIIISARLNVQTIYEWDNLILISPSMESQYNHWLDQHPLLKALK
jgi:hypothetical protein